MLIDGLIEMDTHEESVYWNTKKGFDEYHGPLDLVIDIGAHLGSLSLLAARNGARKVTAYEACLDNYSRLVANIERSGFKDIVTAKNLAVWTDDIISQVKLRHLGPSSKNSIVFHDKCRTTLVNIISLYDVLECASIDYLKISIEGAEWPTFEDGKMVEVLKNVRYLDMSISAGGVGVYDPKHRCHADKMQKTLSDAGFDVKITGKNQRILASRVDKLVDYLEDKGIMEVGENQQSSKHKKYGKYGKSTKT